MTPQIRRIFFFFSAFIIIVDGLAYLALQLDFRWINSLSASIAYWSISLSFILALYIYGRVFLADNKPGFFAGFYTFTGFFLAFYVPKLFYITFLPLEYLGKMLAWPLGFFFGGKGMFFSALDYISWSILPLSLLAFFVILAGMAFGRFNFRVRHMGIGHPDLPTEFNGFKLVHISDLHLGSLYGHQDKLRKAVDMINREKPDLILFTGDLVNNLAEEADGWTELLSSMKAKYGKYSILGNHDYGEYYNWPDEESRLDNMERLIRAHEDSGFAVLLNRSERITQSQITKSKNIADSVVPAIYIAGVENWGLPPFKQYGDLGATLANIPEGAFTILLSHDPSHWDAEVLKESAAQLTLSGHTHGMQFGIRTSTVRWSPVQYKYPRWIGLYKEGNRYLHVTPGLGYIGYAGRIWIPPEISVIKLRKA